MKPDLWFEIHGERFTGSEPAFYDPADFPWIKNLEDNWLVIRAELEALLAERQDRLKPYFINLSFPPKTWKTMGLYFWKYRNHRNCRDCPQTVKILESLPNMTGGSLSILEPGSNINPHHGDTNAIIRIHLALSTPAPLPVCGFQVGKEIRSWEDGKALMFCDAHPHTAWNRSDRRRLILIVDVMRPEFAAQTDAVCRSVLASYVVQVLWQHSALLRHAPRGFKLAVHFVIGSALRVFLPLQRRFGWRFVF